MAFGGPVDIVTFHPCTVASFCTRQNKDRRCRSCCRPPHEDLSRCFHVELIGGKMTWMYPWKIVLAGRRLARSYVGNTGQHWATRGTTGQHARVGGRRHLRLLTFVDGRDFSCLHLVTIIILSSGIYYCLNNYYSSCLPPPVAPSPSPLAMVYELLLMHEGTWLTSDCMHPALSAKNASLTYDLCIGYRPMLHPPSP
jgi:hypothetical protein